MVVAEIPLWLAHAGGEAGGANGILGGGNPMGNENAATTDRDVLLEGTTKDGNGSRHKAAHSSLGLLQNSGRGGKCAIFSVDINSAGTRIATSGGDGTVRLWSVSSLFSRKRSRFNPSDGNYESSEASCEDSSPSDNDDNPSTKDPINGTSATAAATSTAASTEAGGEMEAEGDGESRENLVHDLSNLVRRKKGGEVVSSPARPSPSSAAVVQSSQSSPTKQFSSPSRSRTSSPQKQKHHQRLLCTLSAHTGSSVMAVRFSHNGRFLASAGDDTAVCIYTKDSSAGGGILGNLTDQSSEPWSRIKLCRGHALDVVGLAWAPDDSHLVSCSLDRESPIIVWKLTDLAAAGTADGGRHHFTHSNILCHPYKILGKGIHTSTVKGVTFDPAGTYLASSGDDPAVCIWRAHDDWGLERRIDAGSGIFRKWKEESLSSQSLFRRLSWSTDGAFICSTNCVVKNKHVASTISREGWNVSTARSAAAGAANLVGHKQPVVVSRHCSLLLDAKNKQENDESGNSSHSDSEDEPAYATLLALGDRCGFVTVWSTRKSRPIFKLQCSETRAQVTDLAWGRVRDDAIILLVSLMDGHCVALRFKVPDEIGPLLPNKDQARLFKFRYGIDVDDAGDFSRRRLFVGDSSGPKFIENALQMSLENRLDQKADSDKESDVEMDDAPPPFDDNEDTNKERSIQQLSTNAASVKAQQEESQSKGKKRIRPVLMSVDDEGKQKKSNTNIDGGKDGKTNDEKKESDPLKHASDLAEKAASVSNSVPQLKRDGTTTDVPPRDDTTSTMQPVAQSPRPISLLATTVIAGAPLQYNTNKIQSVDLPVGSSDQKEPKSAVATCTNSFRVPFGSKGSSTQCIDLSICTDGSASWKDQIVGTSCSALAAAKKVLAVGTADGAIQLYGTSPSLGWGSGTAFRSHPLLVLGYSIVALQLHEPPEAKESPKQQLDMLVVTADGSFGVYQIVPELRLRNKGSIMPAMTNMALGMGPNANESRQPKLSRIQITDSNQVLLLLSLSEAPGRSTLESSAPRNAQRQHAGPSSGGAYGSIQAFVYNLPLELWMRVSDGRFVLSDFYSTLPNEKASSRAGVLARLDDSVRTGALESSLAPSHRRRANPANDQSADIYQQTEEKANFLATRSHCEDRMACALALGSSSEFKQWLSLYVRTLVLGGHADLLRVLVEMLLGVSSKSTENGNQIRGDICWWLSSTPQILNIDRKSLIRNVVIAEMSKNRTLQRLTNEIQMELDSLTAT